MLTGATGYLGQHILARLVDDPSINRIYCVAVRASDDPENSRISIASPKIIVKPGDLSEPHLGLSESDFADLAEEADLILHCGANRAFWDNYELLRGPNVTPVKTIVQLAAARKVPLHFVSSGAVENYDKMKPPSDGSDGYVASKWAAEQCLRTAAALGDIPIAIWRPTAGARDASREEEEVLLRELTHLAKKLQARPLCEGFGGYIEFVRTSEVVDTITTAALNGTVQGPTPCISNLTADFCVSVASLEKLFLNENALAKLEGVDVLEWFGRVKKAGFGYFATAQEIVMGATRDEQLVSKR